MPFVVFLQRILEAADFLQNVVTINLELMEEEKVGLIMHIVFVK